MCSGSRIVLRKRANAASECPEKYQQHGLKQRRLLQSSPRSAHGQQVGSWYSGWSDSS